MLAAVAAGGALGASLRHWLSDVFPVHAGRFPWATFGINASGSFVLGVLLTLVVERWPPTRYVRPFLAIGVVGAYTTFSTFVVEADLLVRDGHVATAAVYVITSLVVGLVALFAGVTSGRAWPVERRAS